MCLARPRLAGQRAGWAAARAAGAPGRVAHRRAQDSPAPDDPAQTPRVPPASPPRPCVASSPLPCGARCTAGFGQIWPNVRCVGSSPGFTRSPSRAMLLAISKSIRLFATLFRWCARFGGNGRPAKTCGPSRRKLSRRRYTRRAAGAGKHTWRHRAPCGPGAYRLARATPLRLWPALPGTSSYAGAVAAASLHPGVACEGNLRRLRQVFFIAPARP